MWFSINYTLNCSIWSRLSTYQVFKYYFIKLCFQLARNVTWTDEITTRVISTSTGGINGSIISLLRARWPIFFIVFYETVLSREHSGKVKKNKIVQQLLFLRNLKPLERERGKFVSTLPNKRELYPCFASTKFYPTFYDCWNFISRLKMQFFCLPMT